MTLLRCLLYFDPIQGQTMENNLRDTAEDNVNCPLDWGKVKCGYKSVGPTVAKQDGGLRGVGNCKQISLGTFFPNLRWKWGEWIPPACDHSMRNQLWMNWKSSYLCQHWGSVCLKNNCTVPGVSNASHHWTSCKENLTATVPRTPLSILIIYCGAMFLFFEIQTM